MEYSEFGYMLSNIIHNHEMYSNCKLCLKKIEERYVCFEDEVNVMLENNVVETLTLADVICKFLGKEMIEEIPGFECVCEPCVDKLTEFWKFSLSCNKSIHTISNIIENVMNSINSDKVDGILNKQVYLTVTAEECKVELPSLKLTKPIKNDTITGPTSENYECPKCGKKYITLEFYLKHTKLCLTGEIDPHPIRNEMHKSFQCKECGKGYSTPGGLRVHTKFEHGNAKWHICEHCGKKFSAPSYLRTHMVKHTRERNFPCDICHNKFVTKEALLYHTRRHTGEKPYSCKLCDQKFVNASSRAEHMKYKHIGPQFECDVCKRKFVTATYLAKHKLRHNDRLSKLYTGRTLVPANIPVHENMRATDEEMMVLELI